LSETNALEYFTTVPAAKKEKVYNIDCRLKEVATFGPFLFPFETRQLLFYVTSFDRDRALLRLLDSVPELGATDAGQERVTPGLSFINLAKCCGL
jgi:hypothetical protein